MYLNEQWTSPPYPQTSYKWSRRLVRTVHPHATLLPTYLHLLLFHHVHVDLIVHSCSSNVSLFIFISFFSVTRLYRPGLHGSLHPCHPSASSPRRSPVSFFVAHHQTSRPVAPFAQPAGGARIFIITAVSSPRSPTASFAGAFPTLPRSLAFLYHLPFVVDPPEPIHVGAVTVPVHKGATPNCTSFLRVKYAYAFAIVHRPGRRHRSLPTFFPPGLNVPINRPANRPLSIPVINTFALCSHLLVHGNSGSGT